MQGNSPNARRSGLSFVGKLGLAYVISAGLTLLVLSQLAPAITWIVPRADLIDAMLVIAVLGVVVDARAIIRKGWSFGLPRQTPKGLTRLGEHAWVTPYVWGFDTGLVFTTYRVSFVTWLVCIYAVAGMAPAWLGVIYGAAFALPLVAITLDSRSRFRRPSQGIAPWSARPVQLVGVALMLTLVAMVIISTAD